MLATGGPNFNMKMVLEAWKYLLSNTQNQQFMYEK